MIRIRCGAILLAALLTAGCSSRGYDPEKAKEAMEDLRVFARKEIPDPARSTKVLALIDVYDNQIESLNGQFRTFLEGLQKLNSDYDAPRERFQKLDDDFRAARSALQGALLDTVVAMKAATTAKEWKSLADLEEAALKANLQRELEDRKE